jgi:hypothetical protein
VQSLRSDVVRKSFENSPRALHGDLDQKLQELKKRFLRINAKQKMQLHLLICGIA